MVNIDLSLIDLSKPRVRYNGVVLDKCALSLLIREVGFQFSHLDTTWSDVYWFDAKYSELVDKLRYHLSCIK